MAPTRRGRGRGGRIHPYSSRDSSRSGENSFDDDEQVDPKAYYTCVDQVWDPYSYDDEWVTKKLKPVVSHVSANGRLIFKACNRVYGPSGPSIDDHTWIDLENQSLIDFLRSEDSLKGIGNLLHNQPGIDARSLFSRLPRLKELAVKPNIEDEAIFESVPPTAEPAGTLELDNVPVPTLPPVPEPERGLDPINTRSETMEVDSITSPALALSPTLATDDPPAPTEPPLSAPEQLYILLKFVEEHYRDNLKELERLKEDGYITFKLLWMLSAPGYVVEVQNDETGYPAGMRVESWGYGNDGKVFTVKGIKYVWDGEVFKQTPAQVDINLFRGLMKLGQLPIKTLSDQVHRQLIERGKLYEKFAGVHYLQYNSFVTIETSCGPIKRAAKGRVMIDVAGYYRFNLNASGGPRERYTSGWDSPAQKPLGVLAEEYKPSEPLPDEVLCLTPPAHYGWSFRAKLWGLILVESLAEIMFDEMAFDQLVLRPEYKKMIQALVETHAEQEAGLARDLVAGKGGGMVMVLHGKPGTGKTLTAEAISEHLKCPLYMISSGELGIEAFQLEEQLKNILEMTASWKAVVLIDEADVFLEARDTHDLARNSLVSVFLRLLEYHTGVLILTTNRVRAFDTAFVSRFTIALNYPDLDRNSRLLIWKEFLSRAGVESGKPEGSEPSKPLYIAHNDLVTLAEKPFNGRVIKQLVRGAQALAIADKVPLGLSHIVTVLGITEKFEADWKDLGAANAIKGAGAN
ncbi:hypothetical protein FRC07_001659 [Ceratobasidium sp. 392]|nr:hypothetical protein FRC07_001659 [Ceratobasidium sp. 392]